MFAAVSPTEITLYRERPEGSAQNVFAGPVLELAPEPPAGERVRVALGTDPPLVAEVTAAAVASLGLKEGHAGLRRVQGDGRVDLRVKSHDFPAGSGLACSADAGRNPYCCSTRCPSSLSTSEMNALAASTLLPPFTSAIG